MVDLVSMRVGAISVAHDIYGVYSTHFRNSYPGKEVSLAALLLIRNNSLNVEFIPSRF